MLRRVPLEIGRLPPSLSLWFVSHFALDSAGGFRSSISAPFYAAADGLRIS
jgi:hypothetical protein